MAEIVGGGSGVGIGGWEGSSAASQGGKGKVNRSNQIKSFWAESGVASRGGGDVRAKLHLGTKEVDL